MNVKLIFLIALVAVTMAFTFESVDAHKNERAGICSYVYDGDTIYVNGLGKVRLVGIDAPEWYTKKGKLSTEAMKRKLLNKRVTLDIDNRRIYDRYGRLRAKVYLNGNDIGVWLLRNGYAKVYYVKPTEFKKYNVKVKSTKSTKVTTTKKTTNKQYLYVATYSGTKYHTTTTCHGLRNSRSTDSVSSSYAKKYYNPCYLCT